MEKPEQPDNGAVGYGKPPVASRFKPGQSGNPKGRQRGAMGRKAMARRVLLEKRRVDTQGAGRPRLITALELTILLVKQLAAAGDQRAYRTLMDLDHRYGAPEPGKPVGFLVVPVVRDEAEWLEMAAWMAMPRDDG